MKAQGKAFAVCIDNTNHRASLVPGKVYRVVPDARAAKDDLMRIVDESGEDYLYHKDHFVFVGRKVDISISRGRWVNPGNYGA